ncbi:2-keto-3-deoxygluconate permease [Alkalibacterium putridalgicola]|uniref:2-keto-3-deoxygluconate permease n=1 Tax=Alkalibacterium putridalgicola TaxID=426703 RepID=A0A1H7QJ83_9LACT|nr:2-keto-3-deoxygluconate permease [Alkalibacterium putridalgicola]GEK88446.1 2-keto-3-deoxygluconate permease [Alkalibacterium putridalgicola]SEL47973.1 2-keto-3-deoxygluconate permease [Alkalibacterium putridalgicola]
MLAKIRRIPAGTFLVPLILSMITYTIWPDLFMIGGLTQALFSGQSVGFIAAILTFFSGTLIDVKQLGNLIKRQGLLFLYKAFFSMLLAWGYILLFGQEGILGISGLAFASTITSVNTAIYLLTAKSYGTKLDTGAYGLFGILSLPVLPIILYSLLYSGGGSAIDLTPVFSILIPLILGVILGNLDEDFTELFAPGISAILPFLGWNVGQGVNLIEAIRSGLPGLLLTAFFILTMSTLIILDKNILKNDGLYGMALMTVAGLSTSSPAIVAATFPQVEQYVSGATTQVLLVSVLTSVGMPIIIARVARRMNKKTNRL